MLRPLLACLLLTAVVPHHAHAQTTPETLVQFSTDAARSTANDLYRATAFAEETQANPAALAKQVNQQIAQALALAKAYPAVKVQTGASTTQPIYGKGRTIEGWRMRSELQLESRDNAAITELLGKLQATLGVSQLSATPAAETRQKAEADATVAAIQAFRTRAELVASTLGKKYKIRDMNISSNGSRPFYPAMLGARTMAAEAAPMPLEGGDSLITVTVSGRIEIRD